jgi:thiamine transport system permease protein
LRAVFRALPLVAIGVFFIAFFYAPVTSILVKGFQSVSTIELGTLGKVLFNTFWQASLGTIFSLIIGTPLGWSLYRLRYRGQKIIRAIINCSFLMPSLVVGICFYNLFQDTGLVDTPVPLLLAFTFFNCSVVSRNVGIAWQSISLESVEIAKTSGASLVQVFYWVILPKLKSSILSSTLIVFMFISSSFGLVLTLGGTKFENLETEIYYQVANMFNLKTAAVLSVLQFAIIIILLFLSNSSKHRVEDTEKTTIVTPTNWSYIIVNIIALTLITTPLFSVFQHLFLPDAPSVIPAKAGISGFDTFINNIFTHNSFLNCSLFDTILYSLQIAISSILLTLVLTFIIMYLTNHNPSLRAERGNLHKVSSIFNFFTTIPLGISPVVLGFGMLLLFSNVMPAIFSSPILLIVSASLISLPIVLKNVEPIFKSINIGMLDASNSFGAGPSNNFRYIYLPIVSKAIKVGLTYSFAISIAEFGAASFIIRPGAYTLPIAIYKLFNLPGEAAYSASLSGVLILIVVCFVANLLLEK